MKHDEVFTLVLATYLVANGIIGSFLLLAYVRWLRWAFSELRRLREELRKLKDEEELN